MKKNIPLQVKVLHSELNLICGYVRSDEWKLIQEAFQGVYSATHTESLSFAKTSLVIHGFHWTESAKELMAGHRCPKNV